MKSPGVPGDVAPVLGARAAGVPVWSEIELAARELPNPLIGITGTNGKTTTTELTAHLLRAGGLAAAACGNQHAAGGPGRRVRPRGLARGGVLELPAGGRGAFRLLAGAPQPGPGPPGRPPRQPGGLPRREAAAVRRPGGRRPGDPPPGLEATGRRRRGAPTTAAGARRVAWAEGGCTSPGSGGWWPGTRSPCAGATTARTRWPRPPGGPRRPGGGRPGRGPRELPAGAAPPGAGRDGRRASPSSTTPRPPTRTPPSPPSTRTPGHLIAGGRAKGTPFAALAEAARGAVVRAYLVGEAGRRSDAPCASRRPARRPAPSRPRSRPPRRGRRGRDGPPLAGLRELRPVRGLPGAGRRSAPRPVPRAR